MLIEGILNSIQLASGAYIFTKDSAVMEVLRPLIHISRECCDEGIYCIRNPSAAACETPAAAVDSRHR
jgi:hypothetical protein